MAAFPNLHPKATNLSLAIPYNSGAIQNGLELKVLVTKQLDNSAFDCTNATAATVIIDNGQPVDSVSYQKTPITCTLSAQGVGSFELEATQADLGTAISAVLAQGGTTGRLSVSLADDTPNQVLVASGNWNLQLTA